MPFYASRCFVLAKSTRNPEARQLFTEMAVTRNRLATEAASAQLPVGAPHDDLPRALKLRLGGIRLAALKQAGTLGIEQFECE